MNKLHAVATVALALSLLTGCSRSDHSAHGAPAPAASTAAGPGAAGGELKAGAPLAAGRSLVVTMELALTVADVDRARASIRQELEKDGGYVADASSTGGSDARTCRLELRVPADKVQNIRAALGGLGEVTSDVEKVQDVTEERADLDARLRNSRTEEKRVLEIMTQKTGTISEVIEAEKELARVRESIERMEAQKRSLEGRIDLATVHVTLSGQPAPSAWETPGKSIMAASHAGLRAAAATAVYAVMAFVSVAPILLPIAALITGIIVAVRRRRRTSSADVAATMAG